MDKLKAEIERKKLQIKKTTALVSSSSSGSTDEIKFLKQSDFLRAQELDQLSVQQKLEDDREKRKRKQTEEKVEVAQQLQQQQQQHAKIAHHNESVDIINVPEENIMTVSQVITSLRSFGQVVTLFGETEDERRQRLLTFLNSRTTKGTDEFRINALRNTFVAGQTGHSNDDLEGDALDDDDEENGNRHDGDDEEDDDDDSVAAPQSHSKQHATSSSSRAAPMDGSYAYSRDTSLSKEKAIVRYFKSVLHQWEEDLRGREEHFKNTARGRQETQTQKQCKDYIRPLFKLCKRKEVNPDILQAVFEMVRCCEDGDFMKANDHYLRCAIGNAAWPIGLTMVGIHERSSREKINSSKVAHIMNNELQRKYLTSVKRLMTFQQSKRPDVAPSKKVLV